MLPPPYASQRTLGGAATQHADTEIGARARASAGRDVGERAYSGLALLNSHHVMQGATRTRTEVDRGPENTQTPLPVFILPITVRKQNAHVHNQCKLARTGAPLRRVLGDAPPLLQLESEWGG